MKKYYPGTAFKGVNFRHVSRTNNKQNQKNESLK